MTDPIKLFWWRQEPNFGDAISPIVTKFVAGRDVEWSSNSDCQLYGLGSLMKMVQGGVQERKGPKPWVWGTGCMYAVQPKMIRPNVRFACVRGPITATLLGIDSACYGDPGLLVQEASGISATNDGSVGLIPHLSRVDSPEIRALVATEPTLKLIDVRLDDPIETMRQIAACKYVVSSSLHGLIVADAFGVPNTWLNPRGNHIAAALKFYDYAASIGRVLPLPLQLAEIREFIADLPTQGIPYQDGIDAAKNALLSSFPPEMKE
jgi:pyruvyltransferase